MGKKYKKKVQWRQLSLNELQPTSGEQEGEECEEEEGEGGCHSPTQDSGCPYPRPYPRHPHHPHHPHQYPPPHHFPRRGAHHHPGGGFYYRNNFDKRFERRGGFENIRNLENRGPYKPSFYDRNYHYDKYGRPPYCNERGGYKFGYGERGRRPFRPYGRPGFFPKGFPGHQFPDGRRNTGVEEYFDQEEEEEEWEDGLAVEEQQQQQNGSEGEDKPSQPVHTVMINNEEYTKIQTPRQEVIFKKSSLDRRQDSLDQSSIAGSTTSASGSSSTTGAADGTPGGAGDQAAGDQESVSGSLEDTSPSVAGDDPQEQGAQDHIFEDPNELFVNESGGPPLAGVVMQQAYPGGPMYTIPVHWTPFIDPTFIPGETALTPLDPAFTHVIDPKSLPIDPVHILPVQHDATGCPVQVQVKVDSNGVPIQIEPSAFTVSLNTLPHHHHGDAEPHAAATPPSATPHTTEEHAAEPSDEATATTETKEEEMKEGDEDEADEQEKTLDDKEDKLEEQMETQDSSEEKKDDEEEEVEEGEEEKEDEVTSATTTQDRHQESTSTDTHDQSSSCDEQTATVESARESPEVEGVDEATQGIKNGGRETNEEVCEEKTPQRMEEEEAERAMPEEITREEARKEEDEEEDDEEEEEEEEEDMLTKESEEGSDSSDSQYASMSESSSTPTTPSGELTDPHDTPTAAHATPVASSDPAKHPQSAETDSHESPEESTAAGVTEETGEAEDSRGDTQTEAQQAAGEVDEGCGNGPDATPKISQGYVMVPILTPYYDPSVLYGYPVVVANQQQVVVPSQQHPQQSPSPQQHHNYSKKKKKKYQRRRHVDAPPAGTYLDPQLYTGEPFVATPGGYVVPLETAASVCHIHGIQYVTPAYHQRLPDEGFISLQHSPYLPDVAAEPPSAEAQAPEGTNSQSDTARTVFSDLQDTERQQIQEILQEHTKVGKTDSTESSDSGVSESEEVAATEASSDELDACHSTSTTNTTAEEGDNPEATRDAVTHTQCHEEKEVPPVPEAEGCSEPLTQTSVVTTERCSASVQADVDLCVAKESQACQTEPPIVSQDQTHCEEVNPLEERGVSLDQEITCSEVTTEGTSEAVTVDTESRDQTEEVLTTQNHIVEKEESVIEKCNSITAEAEVTEEEKQYELEIVDECEGHGVNVCDNSGVCECEVGGTNECKTIVVESSAETSAKEGDTHILAQETDETFVDTSIIDSIVDNQNCFTPLEINGESCNELTASPSNESFDSSSTLAEDVPCESEGELKENTDADKDFDSEVNDIEKVTLCRENYDARDDSNISRGRLKDLKVTEAVTRWIREVTPEKAFTLSEEIQSRLLADQESVGDMDTEDEYIEDEITAETKPTTVLEPKNVKGNPFVAASNESPAMGVDGCSKRVALLNKFRGTTPDTFDEYDGSSTISNLSVGHLYSEASSCLASANQSFDEEAEKYAENPEMYDPSAYAKYYQFGIEVDEITPTATPPLLGTDSCGATPLGLINSETVSECGSEEIDSVPHKYDVMQQQYTDTSPLSLATEILKAEKVIHNMTHIAGAQDSLAVAEQKYGNPDVFLKHYDAISRSEVSDSGVQSEDSSDETEGRSMVGSSGVGSSLASTPAVSPAHHLMGRPPLQPHPLKNLSVGEGPVPCKTVCCAVM